jgi:hypothetical protein
LHFFFNPVLEISLVEGGVEVEELFNTEQLFLLRTGEDVVVSDVLEGDEYQNDDTNDQEDEQGESVVYLYIVDVVPCVDDILRELTRKHRVREDLLVRQHPVSNSHVQNG